MVQKLKRICELICKPFISFPIFSIAMFLLLLVPTLIETNEAIRWYLFPIRLYQYFVKWSFVPEIITIYSFDVILLLAKRWRSMCSIFMVLFHTIIIGIAMIESLLPIHFGTYLNPFMLMLAKQTDPSESFDFVITYVFDIKFIIPFTVIVAICIIEYIVFKKQLWLLLKQIINRKVKMFVKCFVCLYMVLCCISIYVVINPKTKLEVFDIFDLNGHTPTGNQISSIVYSFAQYSDDSVLFDKCAKAQLNIDVKSCSFTSDNIVLIIGESYNKYHSSLYGYNLPTNPNLSKLENLYVFDNVISSINSTAKSFKNFLSIASVETNEWYDTPLFPCVFNKAGYNVVFWSNQFVREVGMGLFDSSVSFFYHPDIEPIMFSFHNCEKFQYDEQLIDSYKSNRCQIEREEKNLIIFHLNGQHVNPVHKFPKERTVFNKHNYDYRLELSDQEKIEVANYDNATLYNDSIVNEIIQMYKDKDAIIIYFSDHGDEANDYRSHIGRSGNYTKLGAPVLHCQIDIPFVVYMTDLYKVRHPEIAERVSLSVHRPFMTDNLSHLLMGLAGLDCEWYDSKRDLLSDDFNVNRKRLVKDWNSWSKPFDYDSVCTAYGPWKIGWVK